MAGIASLFFPRSLAIMGASPTCEDAIVTALRAGVPAWGVHPVRDEVAGLRCYPSVADLPEPPELALVLVGHERIEEAVEEALGAGVRAFVVPGLGAEAGRAGPAVVQRISAAIGKAGGAMLGPNCMGLVVPGHASVWIGRAPETVAAGHVASLSQSGSVADAMLSLGGRVGFRCIVSSGGEAVTDAADFLSFFAEDEGTRAVSLFLESVRRPEAFAAGLRACAEADKPVVVLKVGRSEAAAQAALTHTGALVGSAAVFSAFLRRHGAIEVEDFHELVETMEVLGRRRRPRGARLYAVSESGGECALAADAAEAEGLPFAPLPAEVAAQLQAEFPNLLAPGNPLDVWAIAPEELVYPRSLELLASGCAPDVLLALIDLHQCRDETNDGWLELVVRALAQAVEGTDVFPAVVSVHNADPARRFQELAWELDIALLRGPRDALRALAGVIRRRPPEPELTPVEPAPEIADLLVTGHSPLPELESAELLRRYGVPFARHGRAASPGEAASLASELGFPVVVKRDGPAHKSRVGGVVLGVRTAAEAQAASARLGGRVLVARQLPPGREIIVGLTRDPQYGPVLAVGRGGAAVEELGDIVIALAPLDAEAARELVARGGIDEGADVVAAALVALGRIAVDHPEIESVDINPIVLAGGDTAAVDALVVLS
jgi:acetyltransferase